MIYNVLGGKEEEDMALKKPRGTRSGQRSQKVRSLSGYQRASRELDMADWGMDRLSGADFLRQRRVYTQTLVGWCRWTALKFVTWVRSQGSWLSAAKMVLLTSFTSLA